METLADVVATALVLTVQFGIPVWVLFLVGYLAHPEEVQHRRGEARPSFPSGYPATSRPFGRSLHSRGDDFRQGMHRALLFTSHGVEERRR